MVQNCDKFFKMDFSQKKPRVKVFSFFFTFRIFNVKNFIIVFFGFDINLCDFSVSDLDSGPTTVSWLQSCFILQVAKCQSFINPVKIRVNAGVVLTWCGHKNSLCQDFFRFFNLQYSQTPLSGRPITGKSRYPDKNSYSLRYVIRSPDSIYS